MKKITVHARPSDGRIEITNIVRDYAIADTYGSSGVYMNQTKTGRIKLFRDSSDGWVSANGEIYPNIEGRYFLTPNNKKSNYKLEIGRNYIHIS